jgi:predicted Zn-dependent protease
MKASISKRICAVALATVFALPTTLFAYDTKDNKPASPGKADDKSTVSTPDASAPKGKLEDDENPLMIGKRNINKRTINFYNLNKEVALGRQLAAEVDRQGKFVDDPVVAEYINRVGQNIALHSDAKIPFTIKVLDSDDVNAFALPGGFLYVNKGCILAADSEAELAGVMAHEIAHVAARHGVEQASKATIAQYAMIPLILLSGGLGYLAYQAYQIGVPLAFLKFNRGAETEADRLGAQYLWAAGYDPNHFLTFFEKLEKKEKHKPGTLSKLFGSHPPTPDRITRVHELLGRFPDREEYTITTSDFDRAKSRLLQITNAKTLDANGNRQTGPQRPTLKRRKDGEDPSQTSTDPGQEAPKEKPTLKRRDADGKPADTKPPQKP